MTFLKFMYISFFSAVLISCAPVQYMDFQETIQASSNLVPVSRQLSNKEHPLLFESNAYVEKWLHYFTEGPGRSSMKNYLERSSRYLDLMKGIFKEYGLPEELVYMAMAESGFQSSVVSSQNAVGYWQFIEPTGKRYGLTINSDVDERQDFELVTHAAAKYLKDLYALFDDWHLAMAAYNAGENRISKALNKNLHKNYWSLIKNKRIPNETANFVPKIIAMKEIATHTWKYGFSNLNYQKPLDYRSIHIYQSFSLKNLSDVLNVPYSEIRSLNPKYKKDVVPLGSDKSKVDVRIPAHIQV